MTTIDVTDRDLIPVIDLTDLRHEPITYGDYQRWFINRNYAGVTGEEVDPNVS